MKKETATKLQQVRTKIEGIAQEVRSIHGDIDFEAVEEHGKADNSRENFPDKADIFDEIAGYLDDAAYDLEEAAEHLESAAENINEACEVEQ